MASFTFVGAGHGADKRGFRRAVDDMRAGLARRDLWGTLGIHDIRQRYRRSVLGPFWITISMGVMILALGALYGLILRQEVGEYLPYVAAGFVIWHFIAAFVLEGSQAFIAAEPMMRQLSAPISVYAYRVLWSVFLTLLHNIWIPIAVGLWFGVGFSWATLLILPGMALLLLNGLWIIILLGLLSARFRDVPLIAANLVQVMFFITPIIWRPSMVPDRFALLDANPFYHMIEIVRAPLLGTVPAAEHWLIVVAIAIVGWVATLLMYSAYRWRIVYWV
jgi:ABC-2 type transport system permease protein